eukprot:6210500-Pleurochrysis_carterae.AAC.2
MALAVDPLAPHPKYAITRAISIMQRKASCLPIYNKRGHTFRWEGRNKNGAAAQTLAVVKCAS